MKNYEKIQNMSIAELAEVMKCPGISEIAMIECPDIRVSCIKCIEQWLMEEEEGGEEEGGKEDE